MENKESINKELESLSPKLAKLKAKGTGLTVPENYFQALPDQVWEKIRLETKTATPPPRVSTSGWLDVATNFFYTLFQPRYALAFATVLVLLVAGVLIFSDDATPQHTDPLAGISEEEALLYIQQNLEDFDTKLFTDLGISVSMNELFRSPEWNDESIDSYLKEHLDDIDTKTLEQLF